MRSKATSPKSTPPIKTLLRSSLSITQASMTQPSHHLACQNCNNWAHSCVCRTQGDALYMAPITFHHQPLSSFSLSNHGEPPSCSNIASGVGSSSHPISPSQFYINQSQLSISHCPQLILSQSAIHHLLWTTRSANLQIRKTALRTWSLLPVQLWIQFQLQVWLSQALVLQADLIIALILSTLHFIKQHMPNVKFGAQPL